MPGYRTRSKTLEYRRYLKKLSQQPDKGCEFCSIVKDPAQAIRTGQYLVIVRNIFPYTVWDGMGVADHLMIVPKQHTDTLSDLPKEAAVEFVDLMTDYEKNGYSVYARTPNHPIKSVIHQHTHLIKSDGKRKSLAIYLKKPYYRISI